MSADNVKKGYLISITHFRDDPDRVAVPLVLANNALAMGGDVLVWLTLEGVQLAKRGAASDLVPKSFPAVTELLDMFLQSGGRIGVCPPCAKTYDVHDENLIKNTAWMGAAAILEESQHRQTAWF